jgi:hypothetical protein
MFSPMSVWFRMLWILHLQPDSLLMHLITSWSSLCSGLFAWKIISDNGWAFWVGSREAPCPDHDGSLVPLHPRQMPVSDSMLLRLCALTLVHRDNSPCTKVLCCWDYFLVSLLPTPTNHNPTVLTESYVWSGSVSSLHCRLKVDVNYAVTFTNKFSIFFLKDHNL